MGGSDKSPMVGFYAGSRVATDRLDSSRISALLIDILGLHQKTDSQKTVGIGLARTWMAVLVSKPGWVREAVRVLVLFVLATMSLKALADTTIGEATIVNAITLKIDGESFVLEGIKDPVTDRSCYIDNLDASCSDEAERYLRRVIRSRAVRCDSKDDGSAICFVGKRNLSAELVASGLVLSSDQKYWRYEQYARMEGLGRWSAGKDD